MFNVVRQFFFEEYIAAYTVSTFYNTILIIQTITNDCFIETNSSSVYCELIKIWARWNSYIPRFYRITFDIGQSSYCLVIAA